MATIFVRYLNFNNNISLRGKLWLENSEEVNFKDHKRGFELLKAKENGLNDMCLEQLAIIVHDCLNGESNFEEITGYDIGPEVLLSYDKTSIWVSDKHESVQEICKRWNDAENERINASKKYYLVGIKTCNNKIRDIQMIFSTSEVEARKMYKSPAYERKSIQEDIVIVGIYNEKEDTILLTDYSSYFNIEKLKSKMD